MFRGGQVFRPSDRTQALPLCAEQSGFSTSGPRAEHFTLHKGAREEPSGEFHRPGRRRPRDAGALRAESLSSTVDAQRSTARASFQTVTPSFDSACRTPRRLVVASNEPADSVRTCTASGSRDPRTGNRSSACATRVRPAIGPNRCAHDGQCRWPQMPLPSGARASRADR